MSAIVLASEWGRTLTRPLAPIPRADYVIVHHGAGLGSWTDLNEIMRYLDRDAHAEGKACVDYSFAALLDGRRAEGRGWGHLGAHTAATITTSPRQGESYNRAGYGICAIGDFHKPLGERGADSPTPELVDAIAQTIADGVTLGRISPAWTTVGHRDTKPTACPGDRLYPRLAEIHARALAFLAPDLPAPPALPEDHMARTALHPRKPDSTEGRARWPYAEIVDDPTTGEPSKIGTRNGGKLLVKGRPVNIVDLAYPALEIHTFGTALIVVPVDKSDPTAVFPWVGA